MFSVSALFCRDSVVRGCKGLELTGRAVYCSGLSLVYATRYCFATRETPPKLFFALASCRQQGIHLPIGFATVKWYQIERSVPPSSSVSHFPSFPCLFARAQFIPYGTHHEFRDVRSSPPCLVRYLDFFKVINHLPQSELSKLL